MSVLSCYYWFLSHRCAFWSVRCTTHWFVVVRYHTFSPRARSLLFTPSRPKCLKVVSYYKMLCRIQNCAPDKAKPVYKVRNKHFLKKHCEKSGLYNLGVRGSIHQYISWSHSAVMHGTRTKRSIIWVTVQGYNILNDICHIDFAIWIKLCQKRCT